MEQTQPETVIIKPSKFGKGIFTTADLPKNSVLFKVIGTPINFDQTLELGADECYSLQVGFDKYIIPDHPFHLSNHSCVPNCGINAQMEFITLREIQKNEELFWDYSTSMLERHWIMKCECGHTGCRKIIKDFDLLPVPVQNKYLQMGIVLPFIVEYLNSRVKPAGNESHLHAFVTT